MSLVTSGFLSALPHGTCLPEMFLRVGLCVFQQIFEVLVVDRFLELLESSAKKHAESIEIFRV